MIRTVKVLLKKNIHLEAEAEGEGEGEDDDDEGEAGERPPGNRWNM